MKGTRLRAIVGDLFAVPLEDGRYGIIQIVGMDGEHQRVIAADYVGPRPEALAHRYPPLHESPSTPLTRWVDDPIPRSFVHLGTRTPSAADANAACSNFAGGWENVSASILMQWLRANEPTAAAALLARWREERTVLATQRARTERARQAKLTLERLAQQRLLPRWSGRYSRVAVMRVRAVLRAAIDEFIALGQSRARATSSVRTMIIRRAVEALNSLDGNHGLVITTLEREELCAVFADICAAAGWRTRKDVTERWRDW